MTVKRKTKPSAAKVRSSPRISTRVMYHGSLVCQEVEFEEHGMHLEYMHNNKPVKRVVPYQDFVSATKSGDNYHVTIAFHCVTAEIGASSITKLTKGDATFYKVVRAEDGSVFYINSAHVALLET